MTPSPTLAAFCDANPDARMRIGVRTWDLHLRAAAGSVRRIDARTRRRVCIHAILQVVRGVGDTLARSLERRAAAREAFSRVAPSRVPRAVPGIRRPTRAQI